MGRRESQPQHIRYDEPSTLWGWFVVFGFITLMAYSYIEKQNDPQAPVAYATTNPTAIVEYMLTPTAIPTYTPEASQVSVNVGFDPRVWAYEPLIRQVISDNQWSQEVAGYPLSYILLATIQQESHGDMSAIGGSGERCMMQGMPFHFQEGQDPLDPYTCVDVLGEFLYNNLNTAMSHGYTGRDAVRHAWAGYNGGPDEVGNEGHWTDDLKYHVELYSKVLDGVCSAGC
jgi:soluble lytic murein transglycosylase-like protein